MTLIGNGVRLSHASPMRVLGAALAGVVDRPNWGMPGASRNLWAGDAGASNVQAIPSGARPPASWVISPKSGGIASRNEMAGEGLVSAANLAGGLYGEATIAGAGDLACTMNLVVQAVATIAGTGTLSADVVGSLALSASLAGTGDLVGSLLALADAVATLNGSGSLAGTPYATGGLSAAITSEGELLTTGNVAAAVWNAVAASFVTAGSMGEALNTAGSGGLSPTQATMLLELYRLAGLDPTLPLVVTATTRRVPADGSEIDQTVAEAPAGTITVERQ